jgi:hypothetical protein
VASLAWTSALDKTPGQLASSRRAHCLDAPQGSLEYSVLTIPGFCARTRGHTTALLPLGPRLLLLLPGRGARGKYTAL